MTWTYDATLSTDLSKVRHRIGDTLSTAALTLTDEEIGYELSTYGNNIVRASIEGVKRLMARAARLVGGGQQAQNRGSLIDNLRKLLEELETEDVPFHASAGGISISADESADSDSDLKQHEFTVGGGDNT